MADDTPALRAALESQREVVLPPGRYRITGPLRLGDDQGLRGPGTLVVDFDSPDLERATAALIIAGNGVTIENLEIEKRFVDGSYDTGILAAEGQRDVVIRGVEISGYSARYGIHLTECTGFEISGCHVRDFSMDVTADMIVDSPAGIRLTRCRTGTVHHNRIERIEVGERGRASISPHVPEYGPQGYQADHLTVHDCEHVTVTGNVLETSGEGIDLLLSRHVTVTGNVIADIWFQGIKMLGVSGTTVSGNLIRDTYQGIGLADHEGMRRSATLNSIVGNTILDTGSAGSFGVPGRGRVAYSGTIGIDVHESCDGNLVADNLIADTGEESHMDEGIHRGTGKSNVFQGNLVRPATR